MARTSSTGSVTSLRDRALLRASRSPRRTLRSRGGCALLGTTVAILATALAASPTWASSQPLRRHVGGTTTTSSTLPAATTTTVPTMPLPLSPPSAPEDTCVKGTWPADVQGRPASFMHGDNGVYLWHDPDGGWALRVTHSGPRLRVVFSGSLTSANGQFLEVTPVVAGGNDIVYETVDKHTVYFRFVDYGLVDGLNFGTSCAKGFAVNIHVSARLVPPSFIYLGAGEGNPASNPFHVQRVRVQNSAAQPAAAVRASATITTATPATPATTATRAATMVRLQG